jgi:hypothetical protein
LILQFVQIALSATIVPSLATPLPFTVIGTDQGLSNKPREMTTLVLEPGARYDIIFDFAAYDMSRVVLRNIGDLVEFMVRKGYLLVKAMHSTKLIVSWRLMLPNHAATSLLRQLHCLTAVHFKHSFLSHQLPILHIFARLVCLKDEILTIDSCQCLAQSDLLLTQKAK